MGFGISLSSSKDRIAVSALDKQEERALARATRTLVLGPYPARKNLGGDNATRSPQARIDEAVGLARAIELEVVASIIVTLSTVRPATYLGSGKVEEIAAQVAYEEIGLVTVDCALSPVQQRNLEKAFGCKVIDRTGLILEIFGQRARTAEGVLQVELAHLDYQKSRLVRSWTHLERQRGGFGFLGGPGETQIETDRRLIQERMSRIERDLESVKRTRGLHRKKRSDVPFPLVAIVGYTNAGKSTLFNRLTKADVLAKDLLFATLDPTLRALKLPHGGKAILSDTVGFIAELPTTLVSAFRATLEEVIEADVILHVRDISHEDSQAQRADVTQILRELDIQPDDPRLLEVWNKIDLLDGDTQAYLQLGHGGAHRPILVSAVTGQGLEQVMQAVEDRVAAGRIELELDVDAADGKGLHWLYEHGEVLARRVDEQHVHLRLRVDAAVLEKLKRRFVEAMPETAS